MCVVALDIVNVEQALALLKDFIAKDPVNVVAEPVNASETLLGIN